MSNYSFSNRSTRRRRMLSRLPLDVTPAVEVQPGEPSAGDAAIDSDRHASAEPNLDMSSSLASHRMIHRTDAPDRKTDRTAGKNQRPQSQPRPSATPPQSRSSAGARQHLGRLLAATGPRNWIVAGDNLVRADSRPRRALVPRVADLVHVDLGRPDDLVIDLTRSAQRLRPDIVRRLLDIVNFEQAEFLVYMCGNHDALEGSAGLSRFEEALHQLLIESRELSCQVIINTPPCLKIVHPGEGIDSLLYREMLLATALEYDVVLIDHWSHWEWATQLHGSLADWLGVECGSRTEAGLREISRFLGQELLAAQSMATLGASELVASRNHNCDV